jgi:predicted dehydrogenase
MALNVGLAGFGFMGAMHAQIYDLLSGVEVTAVADADPERARQALADLGYPQVPVYESLADLLASEEVDIVDICLPTDMHPHACLEAITAGKAVFCEKPLALTVEDGERIVRAATDAGVPFQVGHVIRFWPEYQELKRAHRSGESGRLLSLTMQRRSSPPAYASGGWLLDAKRSRGALLDLHIHDTDFVLDLLGMPKAVTTWGTREEHGGWTHVFTRYHYPDLAVLAEGGWNYPSQWGFSMSYQALYEKLALDFDSTLAPTLTATRGEEPRQPVPLPEPAAGSSRAGSGNISALGGYFNELAYFVECLQRRRQPEIATAEQALRSLRVTLAELESAESGRTVSLEW